MVRVIHNIRKPYNTLYAGIYVQTPEEGVRDFRGRFHHDFHEPIKVTDDWHPVIARCIKTVFERCPDVAELVYVTPRYKEIHISRGTSFEDLLKRIGGQNVAFG